MSKYDLPFSPQTPPSSFWIFWREYLLSELRAIGHILIMCAGVIFLATALLVGTY